MRVLQLTLHAICLPTDCSSTKKEKEMPITANIRYDGNGGNALKFAEEMTASGTFAAIRAEEGNLRYEYYQSQDDSEVVLLIDSWRK